VIVFRILASRTACRSLVRFLCSPTQNNLLDRLLLICDEAAQPTTRKELAAAILFAAPRGAAALGRYLVNYRLAKVADVAA
jgi:hypothetical protein